MYSCAITFYKFYIYFVLLNEFSAQSQSDCDFRLGKILRNIVDIWIIPFMRMHWQRSIEFRNVWFLSLYIFVKRMRLLENKVLSFYSFNRNSFWFERIIFVDSLLISRVNKSAMNNFIWKLNCLLLVILSVPVNKQLSYVFLRKF